MTEPLQVSPRRWIILTIFCLYSMMNEFQWIQYAIISDKVATFYGVPSMAVDWLSMIFMLIYVVLIFPAIWLLDRKGLRLTALLGSFTNFLGGAVKCFSPYSNRFVVTFVGQTICAVSQVFILGIPARVAAVWFAEREVPFATALGVFGNQLGIALGFFLVPLIVPSVANVTAPTNDGLSHPVYDNNLAILFYITTGITGALFILVAFFFQDQPKFPPNKAQAAILQEAKTTSYGSWLRQLFQNWNFIALLMAYGINTGAFYAIGTLLNQCILFYFENQTENAGYIGTTMVLTGLVASVMFGLILAWTGKYKETTFAAYLLSLISMAAYMVVLSYAGKIWAIFLTGGILGFFMTGYIPVGFELAAEITYPAPEGTSSGLLNCSAQIFGIILTIVMGILLNRYDPLVANALVVALLFVGAVITCVMKSDLKRSAVAHVRRASILNSNSTYFGRRASYRPPGAEPHDN